VTSLGTARAAVATALSTVSGFTVAARPSRSAPRAGDGWVTVTRIAPSTFTQSAVTMTAVIILGQDETLAETSLETSATALIDALTDSLNVTDVFMEPQQIILDTNGSPLYVLALTFTMEVD
jgi:hypothetical protein